MRKNIFIIYLIFCFSLNCVFAILPTPKYFIKYDKNPIPELYETVSPEYMREVLENVMSILDSYVFSDIIKSPPYPYNDTKVNIIEEISKIVIDVERPFYEFYRDLKKALSTSSDANLYILGYNLTLNNGTINFFDYRYCLPFQFYIDYVNNSYTKLFIKEYSTCSQFYDNETRDYISAHENISVEKINGIDSFDFLQNYGNESYKLKNPDSQFSFSIQSIHDNKLAYVPLAIEELNLLSLSFNSNDTLDTSFHIINDSNVFNEKEEQIYSRDKNNNINWNYQTKNGELKCRIDQTNKLNVIFFNKFYIEETGPMTIAKCAAIFYNNNYRILIITSQLWEEQYWNSYNYAQYLFPKIDIKYNLAMKNTSLNEKYYENNINHILDSKTCLPFETWNDFLEKEPDKYGDNVTHYRTKIFNPIEEKEIIDLKDFRQQLINFGHLKKSTDILILTDTVAYGPASLFLKTIQNNGGAIIGSYSGNPRLNKEYIKNLDASLDATLNTNFNFAEEYYKLLEKGFLVYNVPFAEAYEKIENNDIPMAFRINKVDEITKIYHTYDDNYYDEFIKEANKIFMKYNDNSECNRDNLNLLYENNICKFSDDSHAYGGFKCGSDGKWILDSNNCQKSYCDIDYFYNKVTRKCEPEPCVANEIVEINTEEEKIYTIEPKKRYIFKLNTNIYTYFFKSPIDGVIYYPEKVECSRFCGVKNNIQYMYANYYHNLTFPVNITITSIKSNIYIQSEKISSPQFSKIDYLTITSVYIYELTDDNIMYIDAFDKNGFFHFAEYNDNMTIDDINNINPNYFIDGYDKIYHLQKDNIYIGIFRGDLVFTKMYFYNSLPENIEILSGENNILYLEPDKKYQLDFYGDYPFEIRLNEKTNTIIQIYEDDSSEIKNISLSNKYFIPSNQPYEGIINIDTTESSEGALVEILYSYEEEDMEVINENVTDYEINKEFTIIEYTASENKIIQIFLKSVYDTYFSVYGGPAKGEYFYISDRDYLFDANNYGIKIDEPLKNIQIEKGEKYYVSLKFNFKLPSEQQIYLTVKYYNNPIEDLYEPIDEQYASEVISDFKSIIKNNYIYQDIAKNPPEPNNTENYTHPPFDIVESIKKINTTNRKFYEFYQEIKTIIGVPRDLHFSVMGFATPKDVKFNYMTACLPFSYYVDKDKNGTAKIYIKYFKDCARYFSEKIKKNVEEISNNKIPLVRINGLDPFDYIQNWGKKFIEIKSPHALFSINKVLIYGFYLWLYPYSYNELKMEFEFENNETLKLDYYIYIPNFREMNGLLSSNIFSEKEFNEFFENEIKKNINNVGIPNIFEMIKKYKKKKGIIIEEENSKIDWDYQTPEENGIKCRVDDKNQINVILQQSFNLNVDTAINVIYQCTQKFHKNDYTIVVIENQNNGGYGEISVTLSQLLQVKIQNRDYLASKPIQYFDTRYKQDIEYYYNLDTCKPYNSFEDYLNGTIDDYSTDNEKILHYKTKIVDIVSYYQRMELYEKRKEFYKLNLKRSTDIIIFTDSFSFSAASIFIKDLQNLGGAITVGFNGNPFIEDYLFDASQSPSGVSNFENSLEYYDLKNLGFEIIGITFSETFEEDYKKPNPIPREYKLNPVDYRSDIYGPYSDDKYELFINTAKNIFKKYNEEGECNPNNLNLVFESDECKWEDDIYAHGGHPCGKDGKWDNTTCKKLYCDIGYWYSKLSDQCEIDPCTNEKVVNMINLNDEYNQTIILNKTNNIEYVYSIQTNEYLYFFESSEPGYLRYSFNNPCPSKICVLQLDSSNNNNKMHINYFRNAEKKIIIKISSVKNINIIIQTLGPQYIIFETIQALTKNAFLISEQSVDYIYYFKTFDKSTKLLYAEYNETMTVSDIINKNEQYFKELYNELYIAPKDKIFIFAAEEETPGKLLNMLITPKLGNEYLYVNSKSIHTTCYFSKEIKNYIIDFSNNNKYDIMLHLSSPTKDTEISINNTKTKKETILNSSNSYYSFEKTNSIYKGKLEIHVVKGDNAIIEFLYAVDTLYFDILTEKEYTNYKLTKSTIIKFDKNNKNKNIKVSIFSETHTAFEYAFVTYYSKNNYIFFPDQLKPTITGENNYEIEIYNKNNILEEGESFCLLLYFDRNTLRNDIILLNKEDSDHEEEESEEEHEKEKESEKEKEKEKGKEEEKEKEQEKEKEKEKEREEEHEKEGKESEKEGKEDEKESKESEKEGKEDEKESENEGKESEKESKGSDEDNDGKVDNNNNGLKGWHIALIVIGSLLVIGGIIFLLIWVFVLSKKKLNLECLGPIINQNTPDNFREEDNKIK